MDSDKQLILHLASRHENQAANYNEINPGVGVRAPWKNNPLSLRDLSLAAGVYKNSMGKNSAYAGLYKKLFSAGPVDFGLTGGAVTGYPGAGVLPFLHPEAKFNAGDLGLLLGYIPQASYKGMKSDPAFTFSLSKKF